MFKGIIALGIVVLIFAFAAQPARADDPPGAKLFATYCAACHGAGGKGASAPAIGTEAYLNSHDDATITQITTDGKMNQGMPMWGKTKGGTLTNAQIADIVVYLRSIVALVAPVPAVVATVPPTPIIYSQTNLTISQGVNPDGSIILTAQLAQFDGTPAAGVPIVFSRPTVMGDYELGTVKTDKAGNASLNISDQPNTVRYITANFAGSPAYGSSTAILTIDRTMVAMVTGSVNTRNVNLALSEPLLAPEGSLITANPPIVPTTLFLLVVGFIWSIYAFVISQVVGVWKNGRTPSAPKNNRPTAPRENTLTLKRRQD